MTNVFGQEVCGCGTANHDLRVRCRTCNKDLGSAANEGAQVHFATLACERYDKITELEQDAVESRGRISMLDSKLADANAEIERLTTIINERGQALAECMAENAKLATDLRETREALEKRVDMEIDEHHCKYCGAWEYIGEAIRHEKDCPIAVLARYAHLAGEGKANG